MSCIQPKYGINAYDAKNNYTRYYLISYGGLIIPGKWNRDDHNKFKSANQYLLVDPDSSNSLYITAGKPARTSLGFSPYTNTFNYLRADLLMSEDILKSEHMFYDSTYSFSNTIIESDSIRKYLITKYVTKRRRLTSQAIQLNGFKKNKIFCIGILTTKIDSINNPKIWDIPTQVQLLKRIYLEN